MSLKGSTRLRIIPLECVDIGDEISATYKVNDCLVTVKGIVQSVEYSKLDKLYLSGDGVTIVRKSNKAEIVLERKYVPDSGRLF